MAITKNAAQCLHCGDIVESKHRHDFVSCSCWENQPGHGISVDGGLSYLRRAYHNYSELKDLSEFTQDPEDDE